MKNPSEITYKLIDIQRIVTIFYREFSSTYAYEGERHNFWELLYVDRGQIDVIAGDQGYRLKQGDIIFHKPNEFHALMGVENVSSNAIIISFVCRSKAINFFENKIFQLSEEEKKLIAIILEEAYHTYKQPLGFLAVKNKLESPTRFGSEQLMYSILETLLIQLQREKVHQLSVERVSIKTLSKIESEMIKAVIQYMEEHLSDKMVFESICKNFYISQTKMKITFKNMTGKSVMRYFSDLKMEKSKELIRSGTMNFTEIANSLGYNSIHYFSKSFKEHYGMSPTEYMKSINALEKLHNKSQSGTK